MGPLPFEIPPFLLNGVQYIDGRQAAARDRLEVRSLISLAIREYTPIEVFCPGFERTLRALRSEYDAAVEKIAGRLMPLVVSDFSPVELVASERGQFVGGALLFGITQTPNTRDLAFYPAGAFPALEQPARVGRTLDIMESVTSAKLADGWAFRTMNMRLYTDATRDADSDKLMALWRAEIMLRASRRVDPIVFREVADPVFAGRTTLELQSATRLNDTQVIDARVR